MSSQATYSFYVSHQSFHNFNIYKRKGKQALLFILFGISAVQIHEPVKVVYFIRFTALIGRSITTSVVFWIQEDDRNSSTDELEYIVSSGMQMRKPTDRKRQNRPTEGGLLWNLEAKRSERDGRRWDKFLSLPANSLHFHEIPKLVIWTKLSKIHLIPIELRPGNN